MVKYSIFSSVQDQYMKFRLAGKAPKSLTEEDGYFALDKKYHFYILAFFENISNNIEFL